MDKKGITLVELLAALVLFGIVAALVSTILTTIIKANKDIQISTQANSEGNYLITVLENEFNKFELTDEPTSCGTNCLLLLSSERYILDGDLIVLDSTDQTLQIAFSSNQMQLVKIENGITVINQSYPISYFAIGPQTSIQWTSTTERFRIQFTIELIDENGKSYVYLASHIYNR